MDLVQTAVVERHAAVEGDSVEHLRQEHPLCRPDGRVMLAVMLNAFAPMRIFMSPIRLPLSLGVSVALLVASPAWTAPLVPYSLPVVTPATANSPRIDPAAPYTATVLSLIAQLEPSNPPNVTELAAASSLLTSRFYSNPSCHNLAEAMAQTVTMPRIMPLCFTDGLGIEVYQNRSLTFGPRAVGTTGITSKVALGSTFDPDLANAVGQLEGREGRSLMVTGLLGPQVDTDVFVNWHRGVDTPGEDPWLNGIMGAAEVNGIQGQGLMAQVKHFAAYNGTSERKNTIVQDQALHETLLLPYELAMSEGGAASIMCSYQNFRDASAYLPGPVDTLSQNSPFGRGTQTWPLNEAHWACEQPLTLTYVLRTLWGSKAFVGTDYGGEHSTQALLQGDDREDPSAIYLDGNDPAILTAGQLPANIQDSAPNPALDPSGSTCADEGGGAVSCASPNAIHVAGIPGLGCPTSGCGLANAVANGTVPLAVFNQALARVLYQEERFGMLGCDNSTVACSNPGGVGADRSGTAPLVQGARIGIPVLGTKNGDAAIVEKVAEEGAVLLKNIGRALPISQAVLRGGVAVSGGGAEYLIASPTNEGAEGFSDRTAINPLQQLRSFSRSPRAFTFTPANTPTGQAIPCGVMRHGTGPRPSGASDLSCSALGGLQRFTGSTRSSLRPGPVDHMVDFTRLSARGQLRGGRVYRWEGWIYVPKQDDYVFRIQHSASVPDENLSFSLDGTERTVQNAVSFYQGQYYGVLSTRVTPTNAGFIEPGLRNRQCAIASLNPAPAAAADPSAAAASAAVPITIHTCETTPTVGWHRLALSFDATGLLDGDRVSLRLAYSRTHGDIADAAAAAAHKAMALVFVNDQDRSVVCQGGPCGDVLGRPAISSLRSEQLELIRAVAAKNRNTIVVLNTGTPVIVKEWIVEPNIRAVLNMWHAGQEGGTATARLLLGLANPSGHSSITWPKSNNDTLYGITQSGPLYVGDAPGAHPERLNGLADGGSQETQGIFSGYRYYDQLRIPVQFPFGYGLSYTSFRFSSLHVTPDADGGANVAFDVENTGDVAGDEVAQIYVGPGPELAGVQQAQRSLRGFARVALSPRQIKHVSIRLDARAFQYWSEKNQKWITNSPRTIFVGDADDAAQLPLTATAFVTTP
jgi:beta-glucosidase